MFTTQAQDRPNFSEQRIVLVAGGGGVLGKALLGKKPKDVFYINISRHKSLDEKNTATFIADVTKDPEDLFQKLSKLLPRVDVFVYAPYSHSYSSFKDLNLKSALDEYKLNVLTAAYCTQLCEQYFWHNSSREENISKARKAIWISSAAAFGKTRRPELATYSATKAALNILASYAHEYLFERQGVGVSVLAPGSLRERHILEKTVACFWDLQQARQEGFLIEKIV